MAAKAAVPIPPTPATAANPAARRRTPVRASSGKKRRAGFAARCTRYRPLQNPSNFAFGGNGVLGASPLPVGAGDLDDDWNGFVVVWPSRCGKNDSPGIVDHTLSDPIGVRQAHQFEYFLRVCRTRGVLACAQ